MQDSTGYPGRKSGVGGVSLERVEHEADVAVGEHEASSNPHSQYLTVTEADLLYSKLAHMHGLMAIDGEPGEDGMIGTSGAPGPAGAAGATGPPGVGSVTNQIFWQEDIDFDEPMPIPGARGIDGAEGGSLPFATKHIIGGDLTPYEMMGSSGSSKRASREDHTHAAVAEFLPGFIQTYAGDMDAAAPSGWAWANGQSLDTTTYADIFAVIGYSYGGSGANFNLPTLCYAKNLLNATIAGQGQFPLGRRDTGTGFDARGDQGGSVDHSHTGPLHAHMGGAHAHGIFGESAHTHSIAAASMNTASNTGTAGGGARVVDGATHAHGAATGAGSVHDHTGTTNSTGVVATTDAGNGATGGASATPFPYSIVGSIIKL